MGFEGRFQGLEVVVGQHQGVLGHFGGHPGAGGVTKGGQARAGFHQQGVGVAVVATFELDDGVATREATGQAQGAHAGLGARAHQAHHVHAGHVGQDGFGQFDFALGGRAKGQAFRGRTLNGVEHFGVAMTQDHGAPRADVIDVALALGIPQVSALSALNEPGGATDCAKGTHRRIDPTRDHALCPLEQLVVDVAHGFSVNAWMTRGAAGRVG